MTERTRDAAPAANARRRLVRGVFSAPAVLTLYSGGAAAATSNMRCLATRNLNPVNPAPSVAGAPDSYLRYQLWGVKNNSTGAISVYFVKGSDLTAYVRNSKTPYMMSTYGQQVDIVNNIASPPQPYQSAPSGYTYVRCNKYVVLRIDGSGAVVGVASGSGGSAVSASCWNSFAMGSS